MHLPLTIWCGHHFWHMAVYIVRGVAMSSKESSTPIAVSRCNKSHLDASMLEVCNCLRDAILKLNFFQPEVMMICDYL